MKDRPGFGYLVKKNVTRNVTNATSKLHPEPVFSTDEEGEDMMASDLIGMDDDQVLLGGGTRGERRREEMEGDVVIIVTSMNQATLQHHYHGDDGDEEGSGICVVYLFDYHIVYSTTYQQPVLYFNAYKPGILLHVLIPILSLLFPLRLYSSYVSFPLLPYVLCLTVQDGKLLTHDQILYTLQVSPGFENHPFISQKVF